MAIIDVYCISYNEEKIIPYFVEHYSKFCRNITIFDNESTDNTVNVAKKISNKVIIKSWNNNNFIDERVYLDIKQSCRYLSQDADFVIVVDADEFLYIPEGYLDKCKQHGITLPKVTGYEMLHDSFDFASEISQITKKVKKDNLGKRCIFNPSIDMRWDVGCHPSEHGNKLINTIQGIVEDNDCSIILKHYKWINLNYVINRYKSYSSRLSEFNKNLKLGFHYLKSDEEIKQEFSDLLSICEE